MCLLYAARTAAWTNGVVVLTLFAGKDTHRSLSLDVLQVGLLMRSLRGPALLPTLQPAAPAAFLNLSTSIMATLTRPLQTDIGARALKKAKFVLLCQCMTA